MRRSRTRSRLLSARVDPQEGDLADVDGEHAVLGLDVVPAALLDLLAQVLQLVVAEPHRDDLAALEADLHLLRVRHQCSSPLGSTISVSTPPVERGWMNATRLPRMPIRASLSISSSPAAASFSRVESMSSTA